MSKPNIEDVRFSSSSMDDFLSNRPIKPIRRVAAAGRIRVASLRDLIGQGFYHVAEDKLVRLSQQDFWQLGQDAEGHYIERLVDDSSGPVKS